MAAIWGQDHGATICPPTLPVKVLISISSTRSNVIPATRRKVDPREWQFRQKNRRPKFRKRCEKFWPVTKITLFDWSDIEAVECYDKTFAALRIIDFPERARLGNGLGIPAWCDVNKQGNFLLLDLFYTSTSFQTDFKWQVSLRQGMFTLFLRDYGVFLPFLANLNDQ